MGNERRGRPRTCKHHKLCSASGAAAEFLPARASGSERTGWAEPKLGEREGKDINRGGGQEKREEATGIVWMKVMRQHRSAGGRTGEETIAKQRESNPSQPGAGVVSSVPSGT